MADEHDHADMITNKIKPLNDIGKSLFLVENPIRYLGGEYGQIKKENAELTIALVFPDLYEIGMCNQAIKILYKQINNISGDLVRERLRDIYG